MREDNWRGRAACRHTDPELFFPEGSAGPALRAMDLARRVCAACPVQAPCLNWAVDHRAAFGVWGGLTEGERRDLRHALAGPRHGPGSQCA
jgi:WhiB family transcriptional regulator, redox-sensing transcriptional regulator